MSAHLARVLLAFALLFLVAGRPRDGRAEPRTWSEVKCERYGRAWAETIARRSERGLGREFLDRHAAFLSSGCTARADVCPRSSEEFELANVLTILAMNAGAASTFLPFACRTER